MKLIKYFSIVLLATALFTGCKPDELTPIGEARKVLTQMAGSYTLTKVTQTDNYAASKDFPYKTMDVTKFYTGAKAEFKLKDGAPDAFTFTPGTALNIVSIASGTWTVDDQLTPKTITLKNGTSEESIQLGPYTSLDSKILKLKRVRTSGGNVVITYEFEFTKN